METRQPVVIAIDDSGKPLAANMRMRDSEVQQSRKKVTFVISTQNGIAARDQLGNKVEMEKPPEDMPEELPICLEFRIEMN